MPAQNNTCKKKKCDSMIIIRKDGANTAALDFYTKETIVYVKIIFTKELITLIVLSLTLFTLLIVCSIRYGLVVHCLYLFDWD